MVDETRDVPHGKGSKAAIRAVVTSMAKAGQKVRFTPNKLEVDGKPSYLARRQQGGWRKERGEGVASWGTARALDFRLFGALKRADRGEFMDLQDMSADPQRAWHKPGFAGCKATDDVAACRHIARVADEIAPQFPPRALTCAARGISIAQSLRDGVLRPDLDDRTPALPVPGPGRCFRDTVPRFNDWVLANKGPGDRVSLVDFFKFALHGGADAVGTDLIDLVCPAGAAA
mmetsp:Transcript_8468/g.21695  ORF Transcript_8468/g.21695 Transcript_8468/m.21695 type:complete len:231 (+) Transcript_8468:402-1094(+)